MVWNPLCRLRCRDHLSEICHYLRDGSFHPRCHHSDDSSDTIWPTVDSCWSIHHWNRRGIIVHDRAYGKNFIEWCGHWLTCFSMLPSVLLQKFAGY